MCRMGFNPPSPFMMWVPFGLHAGSAQHVVQPCWLLQGCSRGSGRLAGLRPPPLLLHTHNLRLTNSAKSSEFVKQRL